MIYHLELALSQELIEYFFKYLFIFINIGSNSCYSPYLTTKVPKSVHFLLQSKLYVDVPGTDESSLQALSDLPGR